MEILGMKVDWALDWANNQKLKVLVDRVPDLSEMVFCRPAPGLFYAEKDGYVRFFSHSEDLEKNDYGYGGNCFPIILDTGEVIELRGPWSSRSGVFNRLPNVLPCVEVTVTTNPKTFDRGRGGIAGALTVRKINEALPKYLPGLHMRRVVEFDNEPYYVPCPVGVSIKQSKQVGSLLFPQTV